MVKDFDVLVAGAGPAGSAAARVLAGRGLRVGLLDRAEHPRFKLCGGLLTAKSMEALGRVFGLGEADLAACGALHHATSEYVFLHQGRVLLRGAAAEPFRFVERPVFDALLAQEAVAHGAEPLFGREVAACDASAGELLLADGGRLRAWCVIGADGVNSVTRRALGRDAAARRSWHENLAAAIEVELPVGVGPGCFPREVRVPELHVGGPCVPSAGYGWVFPGPRGAKAGICGLRRHGEDFGALFRDYLRLLGVAGAEQVPLRGHPLPYGNALARPCFGRLLLAGDAGGFVEPLFGEGIFYALATGAHAATAALRAMTRGADAATEYEALLAQSVRPEFLWSDRLRWLLFAAMRRFGPAPIKGFVRCAPDALAQMVHGGRSFRLLLPKRWAWGEELARPSAPSA